MPEPHFFAPDPGEPLACWAAPASDAPRGRRALELELTSRGDRVPAWLWLPGSPGAGDPPAGHPLVLVAEGDQPGADRGIAPAAGEALLAASVAVAGIDLPLLGSRHSPKLSERLFEALAWPGSRTARTAGLFTHFMVQSVIDLRRTLAALAERPEVDAARMAFAGFGLGAVVGGVLCGEEPRLRAAVLMDGGGGIGPAGVDPIGHVGRFAPRPLLFVNARSDDRFGPRSAEALHDAAGDPKEVCWLEGTAGAVPAETLAIVRDFLTEHLASGA